MSVSFSFFLLVLYFKKCRQSRDVAVRGTDMIRPVTLQDQEDFKAETGRIRLYFNTEDKFMPVSHNLWSVPVSSYWLRDTHELFICPAVTLNKILSGLDFVLFCWFWVCFGLFYFLLLYWLLLSSTKVGGIQIDYVFINRRQIEVLRNYTCCSNTKGDNFWGCSKKCIINISTELGKQPL